MNNLTLYKVLVSVAKDTKIFKASASDISSFFEDRKDKFEVLANVLNTPAKKDILSFTLYAMGVQAGLFAYISDDTYRVMDACKAAYEKFVQPKLTDKQRSEIVELSTQFHNSFAYVQKNI